MALSDKEDEPKRTIVDEVVSILARLHFDEDDAPPLTFAAIKKRVRKLLAHMQGQPWRNAQVQVHLDENGKHLYTAMLFCARCAEIHSLIFTLESDGSFLFCCPVEEE